MNLNGYPLIAYSINSAIRASCFDEIIVSTDSHEIREIALNWGAKVPELRPKKYASNESPDIEWVEHALNRLIKVEKSQINFIAILRPTNPLRSSTTIRKAIELLHKNLWADSIRGLELSDKHPGKMWTLTEKFEAIPYLKQVVGETPTHDKPTQSLPTVWIQNASLDIFRYRSLLENNSISGKKIMGFELPDYEGFDINTYLDWLLLEKLASVDPNLIPKLVSDTI